MEITEKNRLLRNWRGRRYLACTLTRDLEDVISNLGVEDGSQLPPDGGPMPFVSGAIKAEIRNTAVNLMRLILLHNDGRVSPDTLAAF